MAVRAPVAGVDRADAATWTETETARTATNRPTLAIRLRTLAFQGLPIEVISLCSLRSTECGDTSVWRRLLGVERTVVRESTSTRC
jgi:hypothetical protein